MADINLGFTNISQEDEEQKKTEEAKSTSLEKEEKKEREKSMGKQGAEKEGIRKATNIVNDESYVKDYNDFKDKATPFAHFKVRRSGKFCTGEYYHHFIVIRISNNSEGTIDFTVAHFTSSAEILTENSQGSGKFTCQTISKDHNLLGYGTTETPGLYLVKHPEYPKNDDEISDAWKRLCERLGERDYQLSWNNCEHVVKYILTGKSSCKQVDENRCRADCFNFLIDLEEVGLRAALLVSSLGAIAGSLVRRAYVTIIVAAIVSYSVGTLEHVPKCGNKIGVNIIDEAEARIKVAESRSGIAEQTNKQHLNGTKQYLYNKLSFHDHFSSVISDSVNDIPVKQNFFPKAIKFCRNLLNTTRGIRNQPYFACSKVVVLIRSSIRSVFNRDKFKGSKSLFIHVIFNSKQKRLQFCKPSEDSDINTKSSAYKRLDNFMSCNVTGSHELSNMEVKTFI
ncbi:unnamed protein product [Mytilus coruscus]|uniref:LRAT domain-containing protein n=1 Tax=Mytilus coruscus TaxID=42192 RepID=A0A6J8CI63_MYTCO|nr:unnamed protein product [Mytilus coruscus]